MKALWIALDLWTEQFIGPVWMNSIGSVCKALSVPSVLWTISDRHPSNLDIRFVVVIDDYKLRGNYFSISKFASLVKYPIAHHAARAVELLGCDTLPGSNPLTAWSGLVYNASVSVPIALKHRGDFLHVASIVFGIRKVYN